MRLGIVRGPARFAGFMGSALRWARLRPLVWIALLVGLAGCQPIDLPPRPSLPVMPPPLPAEPVADDARPEEEVQYILLLGTDRMDAQDPSWRTDTIMLIMVMAQRIYVMSLPRDLYVEYPGSGLMRINQVDYLGERMGPGSGPELLGEVMEGHFGIRPEQWIRVHMSAFEDLFGLFEPFEMELHCPFYERIWDPVTGQMEWYHIPSGQVTMNAQTASLYARLRHFSTDFGRMARQRVLLWALREQISLEQVMSRTPQILRWLNGPGFQTNMDLAGLLQLAELGLSLDRSAIQGLSIDRRFVANHVTPDGGQVLQAQDAARWREVVRQPGSFAEPLGLQDEAECRLPHLSEAEFQRIARLNNAVPSRIPAGRTIQVASPYDRPVPLRMTPALSGGILTALDPGMLLTVLEPLEAGGGPIAADSHRWYRVETGSGERGWISDRFLRMLPE